MRFVLFPPGIFVEVRVVALVGIAFVVQIADQHALDRAVAQHPHQLVLGQHRGTNGGGPGPPPGRQRQAEKGEQDVVVLGLEEHVLQLAGAPQIELHDSAGPELLAEAVVRGLGEMHWRRQDVAVGRRLRRHPIRNDGGHLLGPDLLLALALDHPEVALHRVRDVLGVRLVVHHGRRHPRLLESADIETVVGAAAPRGLDGLPRPEVIGQLAD